MKTLHEIGEFGLLNHVKKWIPTSQSKVVRSIGDDVAVIEMGGKTLLFTTDLLIEDIDFKRSWADPFRLGKKALAVNLSDIASMGGVPKYFLISIGLPGNLPFSFISRFYRGLKEEARRFRVDLVGGDTSISRKIVINISLLGEGDRKNLIFRNGARVGDDLYVSGMLGESALGLKILQKKRSKGSPKVLIERHLVPTPRITLGQAIARGHLATAMIDLSDGLLIDTEHILKESHVGAQIHEVRLPLSRTYRKWISTFSKDPYRFALSGGEDYELLFTAPKKMRKKVSSLALSIQIPITRIGEILPKKEGFHVIRPDGRKYHPSLLGFDHFK